MHRPRVAARSVALLAGIVLFAAACGPSAVDPLRVGINPWPGYEFAYLAQEQGLFEQEGVAVRLVELGSLGDSRRAYERGRLDGFFGTLIEVILAAEQAEQRPRVRLVVDYSAGADVVLARNTLADLPSLRGRRVALELRSLNLFLLARALGSVGLPLDAVELVPMDPTDMEAAFARAEVDAVVTYPPVSVRMQRDGGAAALFSSAAIPGEVVDVLAFSDDTLRHRARDVTAFVTAFARARAWARAHPVEANAIMARREHLSAEEFASVLADGVELVSPDEQDLYFGATGRLALSIETTSRVLRETGQITRLWSASDLLPAGEGH